MFNFLKIILFVVILSFANLLKAETNHVPTFEHFTVTNIFQGKPTTVDVSAPEAHEFRTQLRRQTADGPNFAGHYRLAIWGCGSSCAQFAIVDCETGKVYFSSNVPYVTWTGWEGKDFGLDFRTNSSLLIIRGSLSEQPQQGVYYYLWETNRLKLIQSDIMPSGVELAFAVPEHISDLTTLRNKLSAENIQCSEIVRLIGANSFTVSTKDFDKARNAAEKIIIENSLTVDVETVTNGSSYEVFKNGKKVTEVYF